MFRSNLRGALSALLILPLLHSACAPQASAPSKPAAESSKPAAPAAPAPAPAASPAGAAPAAPAASPAAPVQPTAVAATAKAPADKRTLVIGASADVARFDPHMGTVFDDTLVSFNIFDNLLTRDPDLKLVPQLATEWKSVGELVWEFKLRPNVKFHNGDPFTARDVKFSIERTYDPEAKTVVATIFTTVDKIETPDDLTVRFTTKKPDPLLPARLAFYGGQIIPEKYFKEVGADTFNQKPIGSGVVKFREWTKGDRLVLDANKEYWGGAPDFDQVIVRSIPETAARIASLLAGESDIITRVPPDQVQRINSSGKTHIDSAIFAGLIVLVANSKNPPLDNPKIKQALSLAIDRAAIVKTLWRDQGVVANGPIPRGDFGYEPNRPPLPYDQNRARALLQEAGYKNEPIVIQSGQGLVQTDREMAEAIAEMWKKVGVNAELELIEASVRAQLNRDKAFKGFFWSDPTSTLQDPDGMMWRLIGPGGVQDYWRDPEFDRLGDQARFSMDPKLREENYKKMTDILLEYLPWIPVLQPVDNYGVQNYITWKPVPNQLFQMRKEGLTFNR